MARKEKAAEKKEQPKEKIVVVNQEVPVKRQPLMVKAFRTGWYGISRRKPGTIFSIRVRDHFSHTWMEALNFTPPAPSANMAKVLRGKDFKAVASQEGIDTLKLAADVTRKSQSGAVEYVETPLPPGAVTEVLPESAYPDGAPREGFENQAMPGKEIVVTGENLPVDNDAADEAAEENSLKEEAKDSPANQDVI